MLTWCALYGHFYCFHALLALSCSLTSSRCKVQLLGSLYSLEMALAAMPHRVPNTITRTVCSRPHKLHKQLSRIRPRTIPTTFNACNLCNKCVFYVGFGVYTHDLLLMV